MKSSEVSSDCFVSKLKEEGVIDEVKGLLTEVEQELSDAAINIPLAVQARIYKARGFVIQLKAKVEAL